MAEFDINAALGEVYEYGGRAPLVPASYYPCVIHVVGTGATDPKTGDDGSEGGNIPWIDLSAVVYEGPFKDYEINRKVYITPGRGNPNKNPPTPPGGALGKHLGACHAITGQQAPVAAVCQRFGIELPSPSSVRPVGKETAEKAYMTAVRVAVAEGFFALDAAQRLAFVATLLGVTSWEGKRVIVNIGLEERAAMGADGAPIYNPDGTQRIYSNNNFDGFLPLAGDKAGKKGLDWVRAVEFPKQVVVKAKMDELAGGVGVGG